MGEFYKTRITERNDDDTVLNSKAVTVKEHKIDPAKVTYDDMVASSTGSIWASSPPVSGVISSGTLSSGASVSSTAYPNSGIIDTTPLMTTTNVTTSAPREAKGGVFAPADMALIKKALQFYVENALDVSSAAVSEHRQIANLLHRLNNRT